MSSTAAHSVSTATSLRRRALGPLVAVATCVAIWLVGALGGVDYAVRSPGQPEVVVNLVPVVVVSLGSALLGWAALAVLERFAGRRATTIWFGLVVVVTLLSFVPLFQVDATGGAKIALGLMHLAVPAALVALLPKRGH
ncbi:MULTISPECIES: DUF6069 family protein [unclassified Micromonospora]|uniref:DUF6069 family protein n=1 Tax=unclassified Micromonospora TaxID=2617518 RepID=UPI0022B6744B|nr:MULTISPECIES: DUF6069 family protein [unclassified Micromonospora]MCZ7423116.1 DUF6069 family protein [Verrucosispora sp. WMMA2121]WBB90812.1 DUF6069 family protein [Verrucosispora sp. WMMC514]